MLGGDNPGKVVGVFSELSYAKGNSSNHDTRIDRYCRCSRVLPAGWKIGGKLPTFQQDDAAVAAHRFTLEPLALHQLDLNGKGLGSWVEHVDALDGAIENQRSFWWCEPALANEPIEVL